MMWDYKQNIKTKLKSYKVMIIDTVLHGSVTWIKKNKSVSKIEVAEKFKKFQGCTRLGNIIKRSYMEGTKYLFCRRKNIRYRDNTSYFVTKQREMQRYSETIKKITLKLEQISACHLMRTQQEHLWKLWTYVKIYLSFFHPMLFFIFSVKIFTFGFILVLYGKACWC
jgi:hypothetical protein